MTRMTILLLTAATFIAAGPLPAQGFYDDLDAAASGNLLVGMSVAVVCHAGITDVHHYGMADLTRSIPVTDSTMYRCASISKSVTATALMKLFEQGYFSLDDDVGDHLDFNLRNPYHPEQPVTFRMLLSHTAGLADGSGYGSFLSATYNNPSPPHISSLLLPGGSYFSWNMWLDKQPGVYFTYANINYGIIATLIESISGIRFDIFARDSVLIPLGITGRFDVSDIENISNVAVLYRNAVPQADNYQGIAPDPPNLSGYTLGTNGLIFAPQGGLRISATDLCRFMIAHMDGGQYGGTAILQESTVELMHQPQWNYIGVNGNNYYNLFNRWGLGFHLTTNTPGGDIVIDGVNMTGHPGEAYGLISDMYFEKEKQFGLVFMTNGYYGTAGYAWGNYSAFYSVEEEVFAAIETHHYDNCEPVGMPLADQKSLSRIWYNAADHSLHTDVLPGGGRLAVFNMQGQRVYYTANIAERMSLPQLPAGPYFIRLGLEGAVHFQKMIISK